ncbi:NifB/NifX family molybdenum-iron cluster-binding protein [Solidesulfovibrio sp.]|uniref:NifB/NifX family molybdenum-iron cluster-binding protein n=1 Tax=Solidesulfovibrio sp. TaxID=2910990 RepID=UPI0026238CB0|nr:NifB/NifX family molybdenum-iron cluster-binding protein [Solidesulfovibrio sp.]
MQVVVATQDKQTLNGHFALARYFLFYDVTEAGWALLREVEFTPGDDDGPVSRISGKKPFRIDERIDAIRGADLLFISGIGGPIADKVIAAKVYPIEMNAPEAIDASLDKLQALMKGKQPLWLQRILKHDFLFEGE